MPGSIAHSTFLALAEDQIGGPFRAGVTEPAGSGGVNDGVAGIKAGMNRLDAEGAFETAANNQHDGTVHQRPDAQQARVVPRGSTELFGEPVAHEVERRP